MESYIRQYFNRPVPSPEQILVRARQLMKANGNKEIDYKYLEGYLNSIFYPKGSQSHRPIERLNNAVIQTLGDSFDNTFESYDFGTGIAVQREDINPFKIGVGLYDRPESHSQSIQGQTLRNRINAIKNKMNEIKDEADAKNIYAEMQDLYMRMEQMLQEAGLPLQLTDNQTDTRIMLDTNPNFKAMLDIIDKKWRDITYFDSMPFPVWKSGQVFEQALNVAQQGVNFLENAATKELLEEFTKSTAGSQREARGRLNITTSVQQLLDVQEKEIINKAGEKQGYKYAITGLNGSKFSINSTFENKSGKMDILFTLPNINGQSKVFRISAKNWAVINNSRDFGETDMLSAILRTTSELDPAFKYAVQTNWDKMPEPYLSKAKQFGRICILVDVLVGYSQSTGYADTVVVNDRSDKKIKVYSMVKLLNKVQKNITDESYIIERTQYKNNVDFTYPLEMQLIQILKDLKEYKLAVGANLLLD